MRQVFLRRTFETGRPGTSLRRSTSSGVAYVVSYETYIFPTSLSNGPSLRGRLLRIQRPGLRRFARPRFAPQFRFVARWLFLPGGDGSPCFTTSAARTACSPRSCTSCASAIDGSSQNKERRGEKLRRR